VARRHARALLAGALFTRPPPRRNRHDAPNSPNMTSGDDIAAPAVVATRTSSRISSATIAVLRAKQAVSMAIKVALDDPQLGSAVLRGHIGMKRDPRFQ
jgi:hypothetical protein